MPKTIRPRKLSYDELLQRMKNSDRCASLLGRALQLIKTSKPIAIERAKIDKDQTYTLELFEPTMPDGGIVILTYRHPGQRDYVVAYYLDDCGLNYPNLPEYQPLRIAVANLHCVRSRMFESTTLP